MDTMNDIYWRSLDDDVSWALLRKYPHNKVLVQTNVTLRLDWAEYIEDWPSGPRLVTAGENAFNFAFVKEPKITE